MAFSYLNASALIRHMKNNIAGTYEVKYLNEVLDLVMDVGIWTRSWDSVNTLKSE